MHVHDIVHLYSAHYVDVNNISCDVHCQFPDQNHVIANVIVEVSCIYTYSDLSHSESCTTSIISMLLYV